MIRCIEHEKYPNCVRLRTVGTVVSDMGRLRMVKNINFLRHQKNFFDTLKNSDFSFFKRSTWTVFWVSGMLSQLHYIYQTNPSADVI